MFVFDLETDPIAHGMLAPKPVCIAYSHDGREPEIVEARYLDTYGFVAVLKSETLIGHNVAFDMACLCAHYPHLILKIFQAYDEGRVEDTLIRQKLHDLAETGTLADSYALDKVAARYGIAVEKDGGWRTGYSALRGVPVAQWPEGAREYALNDVRATAAVFKGQEGGPSSAPQTAADFALYLASCWGVFTDPARTERYVSMVAAELDRAKKYLQKAGLVRADGTRDTKKAKGYMERLCARRGRKLKLTDKGQTSLDADACTLVGSRLLETYSVFVSAAGTLAKATDLTHGYTLPLQTRYTSIVETLRTSSRKPADPVKGWQAQNPPNPSKKKKRKEDSVDVKAGFRECLTPAPGNVFLIADYPSAELHSVAEVCLKLFGFSRLAEMLNGGRDLHCELASMILHVPYEEVLAAKKGKYKPARERSKIGNYTLWGGGGADSFILSSREQYGELFTHDEFHTMRAAWRTMLPETKPYFQRINDLLNGRRFVTMTHPITGFVRAGCSYTIGANFQFQHLTATAAKAAHWEVTKRCYSDTRSALYGYRAPLFVHDEIVGEGPEDRAHDAAVELSRVMEETYNRYTPNVPLKVEACVSRFWSKSAEPVWQNGRLIPWEGK